MGKLFGHKRYDDIRKEIEAEEGWVEFEEDQDFAEEFEDIEDAVEDMEGAEEFEVTDELEATDEAEDFEVIEDIEEVQESAEEFETEAKEAVPQIQVIPQVSDTYDFEDMDFEDEDTEFFDMDAVPEYGSYDRDDEDDEDDDDEDDKIGGIISFKAVQIALAVICLCLAGVFGLSVYRGMQEDAKQVAANYESIGSSLMDVDVIGGEGLLALQEALASSVENEEASESSEYEETNTVGEIQVSLVMTSVQKDLKIKFTNKKTGKLIANIPFEVEVTNPSGKTSTWVDEDMDGIIYQKNITSGKYTVTLVPLEDEKYEKYLMTASSEKVTVKETIDYQKVDVSAEIKGENEIDVSKEEQNVVQTPVEDVIVDTVAWVESTKTYIGDTYKEISKSDIQAPTASISSMSFIRTEQINPLTELNSEETTESGTESAEPSTDTSETTDASSEASEASSEAGSEASEATSESTEATEETSESVTAPVALYTKSGEAVYVLSSGSYVAATNLDYNTSGTKFYVKQQGYKYTGWNTIDGDLYYFDANGNAVTGEQVIRGVIYYFDSNGKLASSTGVLGIDVSSHNGSIDWSAVANSGVEYVIIRCGYRGYGSGVLVEDSRYRTNINGALNAGLKVGVYFFSQALDEIEAVEEASMVLNLVSGYKITFPIFLDVEYANTSHTGRADGLSKSTRTAVCKAFCQTITNAGYRAGVYANKDWLTNYIDPSQFSSSTKIWLAQYAKTPTYSGRYEMWQYSSTGSISGISGNVDLNMSYLGY